MGSNGVMVLLLWAKIGCYHSRVKEKLWSEMCEAVATDWSNLLPGDKWERQLLLYFIERRTLITSNFYVTLAHLSVSVCWSLYVSVYACMRVCTYDLWQPPSGLCARFSYSPLFLATTLFLAATFNGCYWPQKVTRVKPALLSVIGTCSKCSIFCYWTWHVCRK